MASKTTFDHWKFKTCLFADIRVLLFTVAIITPHQSSVSLVFQEPVPICQTALGVFPSLNIALQLLQILKTRAMRI